MVFLKRHWLFASAGLIVLLCVVVGAFLVWRANQPVETKTVYVLPEPNPERAEILKRALQPPRRTYVPKISSDETTTDNTIAESLKANKEAPSSQENEVEEEGLESMLAQLDEETAEQKSYFPSVPDGFPSHLTPIWLRPGYKEGDEPDYETIYRVLIKLWNQGERGFSAGALANGRVYPIYPDVLYVEWDETTMDDGSGMPVKYISSTMGPDPRDFEFEVDLSEFVTGEWKNRYSDIQFVDLDNAGYDPHTFLTMDD